MDGVAPFGRCRGSLGGASAVTASRRVGGWVLALGLPVMAVWAARPELAGDRLIVRYVLLFLLAVACAKVGKWIAGSRWDQRPLSVLDDGILALILGLVAFWVAGFAQRHIGGGVHPRWAALAGAYLVVLWPLSRRS